jgi:hypothetical protein
LSIFVEIIEKYPIIYAISIQNSRSNESFDKTMGKLVISSVSEKSGFSLHSRDGMSPRPV